MEIFTNKINWVWNPTILGRFTCLDYSDKFIIQLAEKLKQLNKK